MSWLNGHHVDDGSDDPQSVALDRAAMNPRMYPTILADRRARLAALPLDVQVRDLGLPVLAILGGHDRLYPSTPTAARYRAASARVVVIEDAGHAVNVQRPTEVAELIRDFAAHPRPAHARQPVVPRQLMVHDARSFRRQRVRPVIGPR